MAEGLILSGMVWCSLKAYLENAVHVPCRPSPLSTALCIEELEVKDLEGIAVLDNEVEARVLDGLLKERGIPYRIRSYHDSAYDGLFQSSHGWGQVEAPGKFKEEILSMLEDLRLRASKPDRQ